MVGSNKTPKHKDAPGELMYITIALFVVLGFFGMLQLSRSDHFQGTGPHTFTAQVGSTQFLDPDYDALPAIQEVPFVKTPAPTPTATTEPTTPEPTPRATGATTNAQPVPVTTTTPEPKQVTPTPNTTTPRDTTTNTKTPDANNGTSDREEDDAMPTEEEQRANFEAITENAKKRALERLERIVETTEQTEAFSEEIIIERTQETQLTYEDSDNDGVTDFDEVAIYRTDPFNDRTAGSEYTDGERILLGLDPLQREAVPVQYEDPRSNETTARTQSKYTVQAIEVVKTQEPVAGQPEDQEVTRFTGTAPVNSYVTLFIYSTPITVTVRSDERGVWTYELTKELEDGDHEVYVATVNSSGKILSQSPSVPFVKQAQAIEIGFDALPGGGEEVRGFFADNFIMLMLFVSGMAILITFGVIGLFLRNATTRSVELMGGGATVSTSETPPTTSNSDDSNDHSKHT